MPLIVLAGTMRHMQMLKENMNMMKGIKESCSCMCLIFLFESIPGGRQQAAPEPHAAL